MRPIIIIIIFMAFFSQNHAKESSSLLEYLANETTDFNVSAKCAEDLKIFISSLQVMDENNLWAWKMVDATSKLQSGIMNGNTADLGAFDECVKIETNTTAGEIIGRYCLGTVSFKKNTIFLNPFKSHLLKIEAVQNELFKISQRSGANLGDLLPNLMWAACFPSGCNGTEMAQVYGHYLEEQLGDVVGLQFPEHLCQTKDDVYPELSTKAIVAMVIFATILCLVCMSTAYDLYLNQTKSGPAHAILLAFSALTNGRKLFQIRPNDTDMLPCLNGLRVISIMWVILGHQYSSMMAGSIFNALDVMEWMKSLHSLYVIGATVAVDTFFLLSGLLMVYGFLKATSKGMPFNIPLYWLHRYIRLTPAFAAVILMEACLTEYFGSGPMWPQIKSSFTSGCKKYWWSALLYVQNYVNTKNLCMGHSWYLSVDMQLFILSPLILIPLIKWKKGGVIILFCLVLVSIAIPFGVAWDLDMSASYNPFAGSIEDYMQKYYYVSHTRAAPWLIGICLGYCIFKTKNTKPIKIHPVLVMILWVGCLSVLITCVFGSHEIMNSATYDKWKNVSYITFVRPAWAIALCWLIFACVTGYGGPINWFLSFPAYQILARLTYSVYLLHMTFLYTRSLSRRTETYFSDYENMYLFWGATIFSTVFAVVWVLAFESPMIVIEKVIFHKPETNKPKATFVDQKQKEKC